MFLKINTDKSILLLMYIQTVILGFFGLTRWFNRIILVLIIIRILFDSGWFFTRKKNYKYVIGLISLIGIIILNILFSSNGSYNTGIRNILIIIYPLSYAYYLYYLCVRKPGLIDNCMNNWCGLFNLMAIVNLIVAFIQSTNYNSVFIAVNTYDYSVDWYDRVSGLFSYAATHTFCLYMVFVIIYDMVMCRNTVNKIKKNLLRICICFIIISMGIIAMNCDNKAFFFIFPLGLFMYYIYINLNVNNFSRIIKVIGGMLCIFIIYNLLLTYSSWFNDFIKENIIGNLDMIKEARYLGNTANGSNERISMIFYALNLKPSWLLGTGFRSSMIFESGYMGFKHFGQADLGALLILAGVWFTILLTYIYSEIFIDISIMEKNSIVYVISLMIYILALTVYTQCFTRTDNIICILLFMLSFRKVRHREELQYNT